MSTSIAVATVAALLTFGLGRAIRSPLRRWRRRRQDWLDFLAGYSY